jgi:hypothetical protein
MQKAGDSQHAANVLRTVIAAVASDHALHHTGKVGAPLLVGRPIVCNKPIAMEMPW